MNKRPINGRFFRMKKHLSFFVVKIFSIYQLFYICTQINQKKSN